MQNDRPAQGKGDHPSHNALLRQGRRLEYMTLSWNVVGTVVVLISAFSAHSVALAGFGLDSLIEIFASVVVIWQLDNAGVGREHRALRLIAIAFLLLAAYILLQAGYSLLTQTHPHHSVSGIIWLGATLLAMLLLAWGKHRTGQHLGNPVLMTEARVTLVDAYLAAAVFLGLLLNARAGWWWADPLAGLIIVYYGVQEGMTALVEAR
jgi:divalent metal cation (Fe/Co/Zn/Cd) transporter